MLKLNFRFSIVLLLSLSLLSLVGCTKDNVVTDGPVPDGAIKTSIRSASGEIIRLSDGIKLGLITDDYDEGLFSFNFPYTLTGGVLSADNEDISTNGSPSADLYAYAPYTNSDNITIERSPMMDIISLKFPFIVNSDQRTNGTASSDLIWGKSTYTGKGNGNSIVLDHKLSKVKIKLTSELGNSLSDAKVTIMNVFDGGIFSLYPGTLTVSAYDEYRVNITAYRLEDGSFEAILPPQEIRTAVEFIKVETGGQAYMFRNPSSKKMVEGGEYPFDVKVKDKGELPFTIAINYDNKQLGDELTLSNLSHKGNITMSTTPTTLTYIKIRNGDGGACWAHIEREDGTDLNADKLIDGDVIKKNLVFDENFSEARSMILEFYNATDTKFVHKRVLIKQAAASNYLTLSKASLSVDKWGNEYDFVEKLSVKSNQLWQLANIPDWVTVSGYSSGNTNQELSITVKQNVTGSTRNATIHFKVGDAVVKQYNITQSASENATFKVKYEMNLNYNTVYDKFEGFHDKIGTYYASKIIVFSKNELNGDAAAEYNVETKYGLVVDAPESFNKLEVRDFRSDYFYYPNYSGSAATISDVSTSIHGPNSKTAQNFFRQINYDLPIPKDVKRNQKIVYTITVNNIVNTAQYDKPVAIKFQVVDQK